MSLSQNAMLGVNLVKIRSVIQTLELPADIETYRQSKATPKGRLEV